MNSQIEAEKKMKEELKEAERELRKELAKKEEEHEAAISRADAQLREAKHQIYLKENECIAVIFDKNKIEATVLQLKDQIQVISAESDARLKARDLEKDKLRELSEELAKIDHQHEATVSKARTRLQEDEQEIQLKENEFAAVIFDKNKLEASVLHLKDQIQVLAARDAQKELRKELAKKKQEHESAISKVRTLLQEAEQEIQVKENECTAVISDKNKLEASVLHLKDQIQVISAESDARRKAWELEKCELLSAARTEIEAITKGSQIAEQAWNAYKKNLMPSLCRFDKQVEEMSELFLQCRAEKDELESELTETRERTKELVQKSELDRHVWDAEKRNSEDTLAELQAKLQLMAREKKLQSHINEDLSTEVLSLKDQLKIHKAKLVCMEKGSQMLKAMSASNAEGLEAMSTQKETMENEIKRIRRQVNEDVNQQPYISLHAESVKKYRELEEKHRELLNDKKEQGKIIESVQREIASLRSEKSLISKNLDETNKMSKKISEKCLQNYHKVLELEGQSLGLQTELAAAKSAYDEVNVELKNIRGDKNEISNNAHQIQIREGSFG